MLLLVHGMKTCPIQLVSDFMKTPKVAVLLRRNARFSTSAPKSRVKQWKNHMEPIPSGASTWNIIRNTPWIRKIHCLLKAVFLVSARVEVELYLSWKGFWSWVQGVFLNPFETLKSLPERRRYNIAKSDPVVAVVEICRSFFGIYKGKLPWLLHVVEIPRHPRFSTLCNSSCSI